MKGIIIGGGIAGLTTAIALRQKGIECDIYEAAPEIKPVGAGIAMASNAMNVFATLGIAEKVMEVGKSISYVKVTDENLKSVQATEVASLEKKFGYATYAVHRGRLQQVLLHSLPENTVHTGKRLKSLEQESGRVIASFEDGTEAEGDFLLGADGLNSCVRPFVHKNVEFRYGGQTSWRGVVKLQLDRKYRDTAYEAWGGKARFGFMEIKEGEIYWFAVLKTQPGGKDNHGALKQQLLLEYADFAEPIQSILKSTPESNIIRTDLFDVKPFTNWYKGNVCLIGDAAHPTTPNMGQGGAQAVEDALYLASSLQNNKSVEKAFAAFQDKRISKTTKIVENSFKLGRIAHLERGRKFRDFLFRLVPSSVSRKQLERILTLA